MILSITQTEYLIAVIGGALLFGLLAGFIFFFIAMYRRTQMQLHWERERIKQELLRVENEVKEQTLLNVSRELHDNFGQVAALIKINVNMLSQKLEGDALEQAKETLQLIKQLLTDIKSLSASLNGERLKDLGWMQAVSDDVNRINVMGEIQVQFTAEGTSLLSSDKQVVTYRIAQEILSNMLKHSKSKSAEMKIACNDYVTLSYSDNGVGFDEKSIVPGQGLDNIRHRCTLIDATLEMSSKPMEGTKITLKLKNDGS
ncbi:MAG: sensor histidine kinase [Fluviicola sp.]